MKSFRPSRQTGFPEIGNSVFIFRDRVYPDVEGVMARMRKTTTELSIYYQPYILIGMNRHVPYCVRIRIDEEARN